MNNRQRTFQSGLSLVELSVALSIAAVVVLLQMRQQTAELRLARMKAESKWVVNVMRDIPGQMSQAGNYAMLDNFTLGVIRSVPQGFIKKTLSGLNPDGTAITAGTEVSNGFGGRVYVGPLSLGGTSNAYALTYTGIPQEDCATMVVSLNKTADDIVVPIFGIVGDEDQTLTAVPKNIGLDTAGSISLTLPPAGQWVLKPSADGGLTMDKVAFFCNSERAAGRQLRTLTLIRY